MVENNKKRGSVKAKVMTTSEKQMAKYIPTTPKGGPGFLKKQTEAVKKALIEGKAKSSRNYQRTKKNAVVVPDALLRKTRQTLMPTKRY